MHVFYMKASSVYIILDVLLLLILAMASLEAGAISYTLNCIDKMPSFAVHV